MSKIEDFDVWFFKNHYDEYVKFWNEFNGACLQQKSEAEK